MDRVRAVIERVIGRMLYGLAVLLLIAGLIAGTASWLSLLLPNLDQINLFATATSLLSHSATGSALIGFLGTLVTSLSVLIAILIGYNVGILQITGATVSLSLTKPTLRALIPSIVIWLLTSGLALTYLLAPPLYLGQLWHILLWYGAAALLMVGYLWELPLRLSGEYAAIWATKNLRGHSVGTWEARDGFSVLQAGMVAAIGRSDVSTVRSMSLVLVGFLSGVLDKSAERDPRYNRESYRALKDLLSGCAYRASDAPNAVAYYLGFITAGVLLQAVAIGQPVEHDTSDIFSGLLLALQRAPDRLDPMWAGVRHALCGRVGGAESYLARYWQAREKSGAWQDGDKRWIDLVAHSIVRLHADCWGALRAETDPAHADNADNEAVEMLRDMYRYVARDLGKRVTSERPLFLLDAIHKDPAAVWPQLNQERQQEVVTAFREQRDALLNTMSPNLRARVRDPETVVVG